MARSVPCTAHGEHSAIEAARRWAVSASSSAGTTSVTRPIRRAVAAVIRSLFPVNDIRITSPNGILVSILIGS